MIPHKRRLLKSKLVTVCGTYSCLMFAAAVAGRGGGGRLHLAQEAASDHDALLLLSQHPAVQEEDGSAGATAGLHAGAGTYTLSV